MAAAAAAATAAALLAVAVAATAGALAAWEADAAGGWEAAWWVTGAQKVASTGAVTVSQLPGPWPGGTVIWKMRCPPPTVAGKACEGTEAGGVGGGRGERG